MNLSAREKNYLTAAGTVIVIFVLFQFIYFPALDKRDALVRILDAQTRAIDEMASLQAEYQGLSQGLEGQKAVIQSRGRGFSLFSFLDHQARLSGVKKKLAYMQPFSQESGHPDYSVARVKVKLNDLYLQELVDFLNKVEGQGNAVFITSLSISRTGAGQDLMDAVIEAQTLMPKGSM